MENLNKTLDKIDPQRMREEAEENCRKSISTNPRYNWIREQFPDDYPYRYELYSKHLLVFKAGSGDNEGGCMAGNRVGETMTGACEMTCHLTGKYPDWWEGKRFDEPIEAWAAGTTAETTRDIMQTALLGRLTAEPGGDPNDPIGLGTGMIPLPCIRSTRPLLGSLRDAIDTVYVWHVSGGTSILSFKSFEQGRPSFEGTSKHVVWLDEECPYDIYLECLTRTLTTDGIIYATADGPNGDGPTTAKSERAMPYDGATG